MGTSLGGTIIMTNMAHIPQNIGTSSISTTTAPWAYCVCARVANPYALEEDSDYITRCSSLDSALLPNSQQLITKHTRQDYKE